ncbi:MAG: AMP-binding protein [Mobilicoccus sp.]|nr:AMP-binding protein [Mobilicoccus sp.]
MQGTGESEQVRPSAEAGSEGGRLTIAHDRGPTEVPLLEETIPENLRRTAERFPDRECLVDVASERRWSYAQFREDARRLAVGLHHAGVRAGDRVGIWGPNSWHWMLTQYATAEIGAVLVNINPSYRQHELNYVLEQSGTTAVICSPTFRDQDYPGMLERARREVGGVELAVVMDTPEWDRLAGAEIDVDLLADAREAMSPEDPINIQYTSGTTGFPKGALLTHRNILNNGFFVGEVCRYTEADRICVPVPFYHCFGMVMGNLAATSHGAAVVIPAPSFDPEATLQAVADERCTSLYGVPTMFIAELSLEGRDRFDLSTLRTGIMAGSPCPEEIMRRVIGEMHMEEVTICYGMTETSPVSTQTRTDDSLERRVSTVGRVGPHVEIRIVDPVTGGTLPVGEDGEFCTRGYSVMSGYWNNPEKTAEVIDDDGWMHTGDLARMDADGYVQVTGRLKDMVIRGGENIYPREIEEFLYGHPGVADVSVIGVPDEKYGEELMAWIITKPGHGEITQADIKAFSDGKLAHYKVPRYVHCVETFPTTVTGKIRKVEMREEAMGLLGLKK